MPTHYLLFSDDKSHKFWEISYGDDENIQTRWGKVGTNGQAKTKSLASLEDANKEAAKQIKGKIKKGYEEQDGEAPAAATKTTKAPGAKAPASSKKLPKKLVEALKTPSTVTHLSLSKSKLSEIPMEVFELTNLEELELDLNDITVLPKEMAKLKKLKKFHILDNPIDLAQMIDVLATVKSLKRFRCGGEYRPRTIDSIPDSISKLTQLERIAINGTFASVPVTWSKLSKLDVLQLYSPNLRALPADMLDMNITMLSLEEDKTGVPNSDWIAGLITGEAWGSVKLDALGTDLSIPEKTVLFHILQQTHQGLASLKKGDWLVHLNHSLPLVRKATLRCLEELAEVPSIASGASFCLLGKIKMGKGKAKTGVQELSASISKDITKDTIVVLGDKPGDLNTVLEAGAAIISEAHLSDMFDNKGQNFLRPGEDKTKGSDDENETKLRGLLESPNAKNASVAAQIMKAGGMPDGLLYHTFVASFDTELDAKGRDALRKIWKQFGPGTFVDAIKQTRFRASNDLAESTLFKNLGKLASSPGGIDTLAIANVFFTRHGQAVKYILEEGDSDSKKRVLAKLVNGSVLNLNGVDGLRDPDISKGEEESEFELSSVPAEVGELTKLRTLILRAIRLKGGLPEWIPKLSGLEELDLAYTSLRKLPGIESLSKLKILDLHNNLFTALPKELLELSELEELLLAYNHNLKKVPELSALTSLRVLDLSWCGKTGVPKSLVGLEKLEELRLTRAERWKLPELGNMPKLREFEIGNSDCSVFPEQLLGCPDLEVISFDDTDIKDIPTEISKLKNLKRLILGGDTKVPKAIKKALQKKMPNLQIW